MNTMNRFFRTPDHSESARMRIFLGERSVSEINFSDKKNQNQGFSLVELIVVVAIMAVLVVILAPALLTYNERSRAERDNSAMDEVVNAVQLALADAQIYDEVVAFSTVDNISCYVDTDSEANYTRIVTKSNPDGVDQYTFDSTSRQLDETPYYAAGNMRGVTLTFAPDKGSNGSTFDFKQGVVNQYVQIKGNHRVGALQGLYGRIDSSVGESLEIKSPTYRNSEYTIFIRLGSTGGNDESKQNSIQTYGQWSGTNLPAEVSYKLVSDRSIGDPGNQIVEINDSKWNSTNGTKITLKPGDLNGGGSFTPGTPTGNKDFYTAEDFSDNKCVYVSSKTGSTIEWKNTSNGGAYYFTQNGDKWTSNNQNKSSTTATSTWTINVEESTKYNLKYFVSSESVSDDYLQLTLNGTQIDKVGGTSYSTELSKEINLVEGTNTLIAKYRKDGSVNKGQDLGYVKLSAISTEKEIHRCTKHGNEEHEPDYVLVQNTATCEESGKITYKCTKCDVVQESTSKALGHDWTFIILPSGDIEDRCNRCGKVETHSCTGNPCPVCGSIEFIITSSNRTKIGFTGEEKEHLVIPGKFTDIDGKIYRVVGIQYNAFSGTKLEDVEMPDTLTSIGSEAFSGCKYLKTLNIPKNVSKIGSHIAGGYFNGTENIYVDTDNQYYTSVNGVLFTKDMKTIVSCPNKKTWTSYTIPNTVTEIYPYAFARCENLKYITIPNSVQKIGYDAFYGCDLRTVVIPEGVTKIENSTFEYNSELETVTLPSTITEIGASAFKHTQELETFYFNGTQSQWNAISKGSRWNAYCGCSSSRGNYTVNCTG